MSRLDASLLLELFGWRRSLDEARERGDTSKATEIAGKRASVFVHFVGDRAALEQCNLAVGSYDGELATGTIPFVDIPRLEQLDAVSSISLAARAWLNIDRSMPEIKATDLRSNAPPYTSTASPTPFTGKGVLIGVIDDGIVPFHRTFIKPNPDPKILQTRIIGLWDHYTTPDASKGQKGPPAGFSGGTFFDEAGLNAVLAARDLSAIRMTTTYDHGSHVTGIAAGNGSVRDGPFAPFTFVGVAPEADIIFSNAAKLADIGMITDAVRLMFQIADERDQPCVVNMSFGSHEGARDGTSDLEKALDSLLIDADGDPIPGRAVVVAAGNEADMRRHSRKLVAANGTIRFTATMGQIQFPNKAIYAQDTLDNRFYLWYDGAAALNFRLTPPGFSPDPAGWLKPGDPPRDYTAGGNRYAHAASLGSPDPRNGKKEIVFVLFAPARFGDWKLEFQETSGNPAAIDIWVDRAGDIEVWPRFIYGDAIIDNTVTSPATARSAIAVGAYISEPGSPVISGEHYGDICAFSSWGLDSIFGVTAEQTRPILVAPGRRIISANESGSVNQAKDYFLSRFDGWFLTHHVQYNGTSQAAPHVAGTIALMFQRNPDLTFKDIIAIFQATASKAQIPAGLTFPNRTWGYGKLDARAAVLAIPAPGGGPP